MGRRPTSITVVGWLFVVVGCASFAGHAWQTWQSSEGGAALEASERDLGWVAASAVLAVAGGAGTLRGRNWARWALAMWMTGHVVLSLSHSPTEVAVHAALFTPLSFLLFRPAVGAYFRRVEVGSR